MASSDWDWIRKKFGAVTKPGIPSSGWVKVFMAEATPAERKKAGVKAGKKSSVAGEEEAEEEDDELELEAPYTPNTQHTHT